MVPQQRHRDARFFAIRVRQNDSGLVSAMFQNRTQCRIRFCVD